ncbi:hypothetical protein Nocox_41830 [Nonomuraea coxensis DSM 45129]|uniref:Integral membrane protein n=1 Tax=Nonomuraea coxensis DSM 45129 TaxID=1122611 RepID=A0ABX8UE00_9ACTN|nr:hypothetical protein [Nonomuraea coxensis]QYC45907.1 hypothetical protein Nocox_41830 [Nonomuraea coxensis DSM 45129]
MSTPHWTLRALRVVVPLHVVALLFQAVTAGLLLSEPGGRAAHMASAVVLAVVGVLHLAAALLAWRSGGAPVTYVPPAALLMVATVVVSILGMMHVKTLHVPLGVMMFGTGVFQLTRVGYAWGGRRSERGQTYSRSSGSSSPNFGR